MASRRSIWSLVCGACSGVILGKSLSPVFCRMDAFSEQSCSGTDFLMSQVEAKEIGREVCILWYLDHFAHFLRVDHLSPITSVPEQRTLRYLKNTGSFWLTFIILAIQAILPRRTSGLGTP